jgi:SAM-dependent methyltransferase
MNEKEIYPARLYFRKFLYTFLPKFLFKLSPTRYWTQRHWRNQNQGDIHGFDKYLVPHPRVPVILSELKLRVQYESSILDLGCNCGYYLSLLKKEGYKNLSGIDISPVAIQYGKEHLDLADVNLTIGSFEEALPKIIGEGIQYDLVYTLGATVELVHPSFDIIGNISKISRRFVVLIINESGHSYPRFWEYEFNRNGFLMVKCIRPFDGESSIKNPVQIDSLMVFERIF